MSTGSTGTHSTRFGRFVLETDAERVRLRVVASDGLPLSRAAAIAAFGLAAVFPEVAFASPVQYPLAILVPVMLWLWLIDSGVRTGKRAGARRSRFAPVQRLVELTGSGGAAADAFRAEGRSESLVVDGQTFPSSDYRGVVLARSEERQPFKRGVTVTRFRPTLLLRDRAFELGTFDGADEADARELGEAVASTLAGHPVKCPSVDWHVPTGPASVPALLAELLLFWTAMMGGLYVTASGRLPLWAGVRAAMVLVVAADVLNARLISRNAAQALSRKAEELIKSARPALSRAG